MTVPHRRTEDPLKARLALLAALAAPFAMANPGPAGAVDPVTNAPVIAVAGDIACEPGAPVTPTTCHHSHTSNLVDDDVYDAVIPLGDNQYVEATLDEYRTSYHRTWGRVLAKTFPVAGNHEYRTPDAAGYFDYFGGDNPAAISRPTGGRTRGYYSFDIGAWHVVVLNSNCKAISTDGTHAGGCGTSSPQGQWLEADLAAHPTRCTLAAWHHPRFSSHANNKRATNGFWKLLYAADADVVVNGHAHTYERFAPQTRRAVPDDERGLVELVVGTGGHSLMSFDVPEPNSVARDNTTFGILALTLHPTGWDFEFVAEPGGAFTDAGSAACH